VPGRGGDPDPFGHDGMVSAEILPFRIDAPQADLRPDLLVGDVREFFRPLRLS
jgi:hypothetical protein